MNYTRQNLVKRPIARMMTQVTCPVVCLISAVALAQVPPTPKPSTHVGTARPRLFVQQRVLDLGRVIEGETVPLRWRIENRGTAPLVIKRTKAGCGCTVVSLSNRDRRIPGGQSIELTANFNSTGRPGEQVKTVTVFSNDPDEPKLKLEFRATVEQLFIVSPQGFVNVQGLRRGNAATRTIDISPAVGHVAVELLSVDVPEDASIVLEPEPLDADNSTGWRLRIRVKEDAPLGPIRAKVIIKLRVDEFEREHTSTVRGDVVGDISWHPRWINDTNKPSRPGKQFAPVILNATAKRPVKILSANAGPLLMVNVSPPVGSKATTRHRVNIKLAPNVPPGPFGATLRILTDCLDQPVIEVPIYANVASPVAVDPAVVLLRADGTPVGTNRRVTLKGWAAKPLEIVGISCDLDAVQAEVDTTRGPSPIHMRYLRVTLTGTLPSGTHEGTLTVTTTLEGAESIEIPVRVVVPK